MLSRVFCANAGKLKAAAITPHSRAGANLHIVKSPYRFAPAQAGNRRHAASSVPCRGWGYSYCLRGSISPCGDGRTLDAVALERGGDEARGFHLLDEFPHIECTGFLASLRCHRLVDDHEPPRKEPHARDA